jgi:hypothetical protein
VRAASAATCVAVCTLVVLWCVAGWRVVPHAFGQRAFLLPALALCTSHLLGNPGQAWAGCSTTSAVHHGAVAPWWARLVVTAPLSSIGALHPSSAWGPGGRGHSCASFKVRLQHQPMAVNAPLFVLCGSWQRIYPIGALHPSSAWNVRQAWTQLCETAAAAVDGAPCTVVGLLCVAVRKAAAHCGHVFHWCSAPLINSTRGAPCNVLGLLRVSVLQGCCTLFHGLPLVLCTPRQQQRTVLCALCERCWVFIGALHPSSASVYGRLGQFDTRWQQPTVLGT